jgi:hypothetical protein
MRGMGLRTLRPHAGRRGSSEPVFASTVPRDAHCALSAAVIACTTARFSLLYRASTSLPSGSTMMHCGPFSSARLRLIFMASTAWAGVDRRVVDAAGWVPLVTPRALEFLSSRVRNYQYHPIWGA